MYRSIAISGPIASGTSTTGKSLAEKLGLKYHSAGEFFREYAIKNNFPLHDKEQIPDEIDKKIDTELTQNAKEGDTVVDAHYIGYFTHNMPHVLKVLLTCDYEMRIGRAATRIQPETEEEIRLREEGLDKKFRKIYANENFLDPKFFDLIIDTTSTKPEEVVENITKKFKGQD